MDLRLDESQEILRSTFLEMLERECPITLVRESEETGYSESLWARYQELGALVMGLPEEVGGLEMNLLELGLVAQASGRALAPVPFLETAASGRLLTRLAQLEETPSDTKETALNAAAAIATGDAITSLALPRPFAVLGTQSDVDDDQCERLIPFGARARDVLFHDGRALYLIGGAENRRSARLADSGSGALASWTLSERDQHDSVTLARDAVAAKAIARASAEWKLLAAFWLVGLAQRALEIGSEYARDRIQFGVPIGGFQGIAHPLADAATRLDGAELLGWEAAWADEAEPERFEALASMAFAWAGQTALRTTDVSLHTHGGYGFSSEYDIQLYYRRASALASIAGGTREELQSVASLALSESAAAHTATAYAPETREA